MPNVLCKPHYNKYHLEMGVCNCVYGAPRVPNKRYGWNKHDGWTFHSKLINVMVPINVMLGNSLRNVWFFYPENMKNSEKNNKSLNLAV